MVDVSHPTSVESSSGDIVSLNIRQCLTRSLRNRFKAFCSMEEISMERAVVRLIEAVLDRKINLDELEG